MAVNVLIIKNSCLSNITLFKEIRNCCNCAMHLLYNVVDEIYL